MRTFDSLRYAFVGLIALLTITSCGNDDSLPQPDPSQTQGLILDNIVASIFDASNENRGSAAPGTSEGPDNPLGTTSGTDVSKFEVHIRSLDDSGGILLFDQLDQVPDTVFLKSGRYQVYVQNRGFPDPAFDYPHYSGLSEEIDIDLGQFKPVVVQVNPNSRVKIEYTYALTQIFDTYSTKITDRLNRSLEYAQTEERFGYFNSRDTLEITVTLHRVGSDGTPGTKTVTATIPDTEAGKSYTLRVNATLGNGGLLINAELNDEWEEVEIGIGDPEDAPSEIVTNRTISFDINNLTKPFSDSRNQPFYVKTSTGEAAVFDIYLSESPDQLGDLVLEHLTGHAFLISLSNIQSNRIAYVTALGTFPDGEVVEGQFAVYLQAEPVENPATFVFIDSPLTEEDQVINENTQPELFTSEGKLKLRIVRISTDIIEIRYREYVSIRTNLNSAFASKDTLEWVYPYENFGIMQSNFVAKNTHFLPFEYTAYRHWYLLRRLDASKIDIQHADDGIHISYARYRQLHRGVVPISVWRTDTPEFTGAKETLISNFTSNVTSKIIDKSPGLEVGKTVFYHIQFAQGYLEESAKTNIVTIPYTQE